MRFLPVPLALGVAYCILSVGAAPSAPDTANAVTYSSIRDLSREEQTNALSGIPKDARFSIWKDRLQTYHDEHLDTLDRLQVNALNEALHIAKTHNLTAEPAVRKNMQKAFGDQKAIEIVTTLGGKSQELNSRDVPACNCNQDSDWCGWNPYCQEVTDAPCEVYAPPGDDTCGTFGMYFCTGLCSS